jgi:KDO2-lipid IV(A) lauroyltransferase
MFLEKLWNLLSFDLLPTLPVEAGPWAAFLFLAFAFFPSYVAYCRRAAKRRHIYLFSVLDAVMLGACLFVPVERFYFDLGTLAVFAKTLYVLLLVWAMADRSTLRRKIGFVRKFAVYPAESLAAHAAYVVFKLMPVEWASALGGFLGRFVGSIQVKYNRLAKANLDIAFKGKSDDEKAGICCAMWDMLGRYCAESAHYDTVMADPGKYLELVGDNILDRLKGRPFIVMDAHYGSVGMLSVPFAMHGAGCSIIYKYPHNELNDGLVTRSFGRGQGDLEFIPNDRDGTRKAMRALASGSAVLVSPDQRVGDVPTKFFGHSVRSPAGAARLAGHFGCPILPVQLVRVDGPRHRIIFHRPVAPIFGANRRVDEVKTMQMLNDIIEGWIRENPGQWFWIHDRFGIKDAIR